MSDHLDKPTPIRIDIPNAKPQSPDYAAADLVIDAIRESGLDPDKAVRIPIMASLVKEWLEGKRTRAQFVGACRKLALFNIAEK